MPFSRPSLHPPVALSLSQRASVRDELRQRAQQRAAAAVPPAAIAIDTIVIALTTVSLNSNFDAYLDVSFQGSPSGFALSMMVDSGNSMLIVPRWEDIEALPDWQQHYEVLGSAHEPWGCPAQLVHGPIQLHTVEGGVCTLSGCLFYACTADGPEGGGARRTSARDA